MLFVRIYNPNVMNISICNAKKNIIGLQILILDTFGLQIRTILVFYGFSPYRASILYVLQTQGDALGYALDAPSGRASHRSFGFVTSIRSDYKSVRSMVTIRTREVILHYSKYALWAGITPVNL